MINKTRYGQKQTSPILQWSYIVVFLLASAWLVVSIVMKENPIEVLSNTFSKIPSPNSAALSAELAKKDSIIEDLKTRLASYEGIDNFRRGIVIIESPTLNLRESPTLSSDIVFRIPANAEVAILYYDTEIYYLNGEPGKWCRISYAGTEGWAWGNFINEI